MTEQQFAQLLIQHEQWLDNGASTSDEHKKLRLEYEIVTGYWSFRNFMYSTLSRCIFRNVTFDRCNFNDWWVKECSFFGCSFSECTFNKSYMCDGIFCTCDFVKCNFCGCTICDDKIDHCEFRESVLDSCSFQKSSITNTGFDKAEFKNGINFVKADIQNSYLPEGYERMLGVTLKEPIIGYKKTREGVVIKAEIPAGAIVFSINGKKCRTNRAKIVDMRGHVVLHSSFDINFHYTLGQEIEILDFDPCYSHECAPGFHFFMTEEEAKAYAV